jgi:dipeptidyl aminopeptidase/acylaminoacyl peptidase
VSPITHVTAEAAPTLIVVGDADSFIPPQQSRRMAARLQAAGVPSKLIVVPDGEHDEALVRAHIPSALAWFDLHLAPKSARARP